MGQKQRHSCCAFHLLSYKDRAELAWGQGSMLPGGLLLHPNPTEMHQPVMEEMEGCILLASLLALCCPRIPLPLLHRSWQGPQAFEGVLG